MSEDIKGPAQIWKHLIRDGVDDPVGLFFELLEELPGVLKQVGNSNAYPFILFTANAIVVNGFGNITLLGNDERQQKQAMTFDISELSRMMFGAWLLDRTESLVGEGVALGIMGISPFSGEIIEFVKDNARDIVTFGAQTVTTGGAGFIPGGTPIVKAFWATTKIKDAEDKLGNYMSRVQSDYYIKVIQAGNILGLKNVMGNMKDTGRMI